MPWHPPSHRQTRGTVTGSTLPEAGQNFVVLAHDSDAMLPEPVRQRMENLHTRVDTALMS